VFAEMNILAIPLNQLCIQNVKAALFRPIKESLFPEQM